MAAIKLGQVRLIEPLFNKGLSPDSTLAEILYIVGLALLLALINLPVRFAHYYWMIYTVDSAICDIRIDIYKKIQRLPMSFYSTSKQGDLISTILNDTTIFSMGIKSLIDLVREPVTLFALLGYAIYLNWQLTLIMFLIIPLLLYVFTKLGRRVRAHQAEVQNKLADMTHMVSEGIAGQKVIKAFNLQYYILDYYSNFQKKFFKFQMKTAAIQQLAHPLVEFITMIGLSVVIVFAQIKISEHAMTTGEFVAFIAIMAMIQDPIRKANDANLKINQAQSAEKRIFHLLNTAEETDLGEISTFEFKESIDFKNFSFSYGEGDVLKDVSFSVKKGEKVALVGLSGSGKSTIINLLLGLYPVTEGQLLIDGVPINHLQLQVLRDLFGLVSQDIFLFNNTITENLQLGNDYDQLKVKQSLSVAHANEFIDLLPEKMDTIIGDRGIRLSGGQCQRLTIARAFLQDPPILLFDEATSALDNESEKIVQTALGELASNKTVIAVAHRLSTIKDYDKIIVLKEGRIIEEGNHRDLVNLNGEYKKLYDLSLKE